MKIHETASINQIGFASQFVDKDVEYQVREFHQSCITPVGSGFESLFGFPALTPAHLKRAEFVETRFSHLTQTIDIPREEAVESVGRFESLRHGDAEIDIEFSLISRIFAQALAADQQRRRPYPSGGALYTVEAVLITGPRVRGGQSLSALHFLPVSNAFEVLTTHVAATDFSSLTDIPNPSFCVLYCVNLKKSIFKYRSRGYRLSLLEAGSMYQNMLACAQTFGFHLVSCRAFPSVRLHRSVIWTVGYSCLPLFRYSELKRNSMAIQHRFRSVITPVPNFVVEASSSPLISEPSVFGASDDSRIQGHGFGYGPDIHLKAFGEYMERFVAFRNIASNGGATIDELNISRETKYALKAAMIEACGAGQLGTSLAAHRFDTVAVLDMRTGQNAQLPQVLFTLHTTADQQFVPTRDTSGSALHPNKEMAFKMPYLNL